ncbi:hypothetical protein Godav_006005, partial [Gossypium davidsonii]|nr:hypothetical protein [Gossypium davidsonii]
MKGISYQGSRICFGRYALQALEIAWITSRQIEARRRVMTRNVHHGGKLWVRIFPGEPVTVRPTETRMGSRKGSLEYWVAVVKPDIILYEMSGVAENIARKAISITFGGLPTKDPRLHLRPFLVVCESFRQQGVLEDALRVKLFPYSLRDRSKAWLNALSSRTVASWNDLFQRKCLMHGFQHLTQMEMFYNRLNAHTRMLLDVSANVGTGRRVAGTTELDAITSLTAQHYKAITLRSGTQLNDVMKDVMAKEDGSRLEHEKISESAEKHTTSEKNKQKNIMAKSNHQLRINIPPVEVLEKMPNYVKLMEDMLSKKRRLGEFETVALIEWKLGIGKARPTIVMLQLADRSYAYPEGEIEDTIVTFN